MTYRIKISLGCLIMALCFGCASKKKIPAIPQISSSITVEQVWDKHTSQGNYTYFSPQLVEDYIIEAGHSDIKMIDAQTGSIQQTIRLKKKIVSGIASNGNMFIVASLKGDLYAYDNKGTRLWEVQTSTQVIAPAVFTPTGQVIVRTIDGRITAYAQVDGKQQWQFVRPVPPLSLRNYAPVTVMGGLVFAGLSNGQMVSLIEENGVQAWEAYVAVPHGATELERAVDVLSRPLVVGQQVCAVAYQGRIGCFSGGNGSPIWAREMSSIMDLATDGNLLFGVTTTGDVMAFESKNGTSAWHLTALNGRVLGAPVIFDQYLVFGDMEGYVYFVNKDSGNIEAIKRIGKASIRQQPIVYKNSIIIKTTKGDLVALRV